MAGPVKARAVVLGSRPLGEADRIVRLFTRELGRVDAVVKGVRKTTSRWGGRLEPFNVSDLLLHPGRSLYTVTQAQLVDVYVHLRMDREGLAAAAVVCEAAAGLTPEHEPEERVFALLRNTLRELDRGFDGRAVEAPLVLGALLKLLHEAGYQPVLDACAACGTDGRALGFSAARGGLVCADCVGEGVPVTPEATALMRRALAAPLAELREHPASAQAGEALRNVHQLYAYHTGSRLRALRIAGAG
jgi:DNA repair protein RecO (recombination protein O)